MPAKRNLEEKGRVGVAYAGLPDVAYLRLVVRHARMMGAYSHHQYPSREALAHALIRVVLCSPAREAEPTHEDQALVTQTVFDLLPTLVVPSPEDSFSLSGKLDWERYLTNPGEDLFVIRNAMDFPRIDIRDLNLKKVGQRLHGFVGNFPATYQFTGCTLQADYTSPAALGIMRMTPLIAQYTKRTPRVLATPHFSHCTVTAYENDGRLKEHEDGEKDHASHLIASVSFGQEATFRIHPKNKPPFDLQVRDGDLIFFHRFTRHEILAVSGKRINLTFRNWVTPYLWTPPEAR
jgi:hypothetical protein